MNTPINEFSMPIFRNGDIGIPTESPHANETAVDIDLIHTIFILGLDAARIILGSNDRASAPITPPAPILPAAWPVLANAGSPDGCDTQRGTSLAGTPPMTPPLVLPAASIPWQLTTIARSL